MSQSMIERVARAICGTTSGTGDDHQWKMFLDEARAAIEAMREPTDAILAATEDVVTGHDDFACGDGTLYLSYPGFHEYAKTAWQAMIDAALNEQVKS